MPKVMININDKSIQRLDQLLELQDLAPAERIINPSERIPQTNVHLCKNAVTEPNTAV